ncbi:MAG: carbohydrate-binding protein [Vicinamibacterales bacterium]
MCKKALAGAGAVCAVLLMSAPRAHAAGTDVVLYANDATRLAGTWARTPDATAAGAIALTSPDRGWSTDAPLASPKDYVEFTFDAPQNTPYRIWVRLKAAGNSKFNDSVFAQFSDAAAPGGSPLYRIGSTNALTLNFQDSSAGKLAGWGWLDGAYWLSQQSTILFTSAGTHTLRVQTREDGVQLDQVVLSPSTYLGVAPGQRSGDSTIVPKPAPAVVQPTPFSGAAVSLPGTLQAEDFDLGGEGVGYHDGDTVNSGGAYRAGGVDIETSSDGGYNVGWIAAGEWLGYSVNVSAAGQYLLEARLAAPAQGGTFHVEFGAADVTGPIAVPGTGSWQTWTTISKLVTLTAGPQRARIVFDTAGASGLANLNWIRLALASSTPFSGTPIALPGTIAVEQFDNGGQGIAYRDTSAGNSGGAARATDVDLERSSLGGYDIGWTADGEWVGYSVNVAAAGAHRITAKVASPSAVGRLSGTVGATTLAQLAVPNTGGWQVWQEVSWTETLAAGPQKLTLSVDVGGFNLGSIVVDKMIEPASEPTVIPPPPPPPDPEPEPEPEPDPAPQVPPTRQITVSESEDLQAAIDAAQPGDVILLQAGATFSGNFTLPPKTGDGYVTIRTNIADPVPPGTRITPATAAGLAKIKSSNTYTALRTQPYAHHYVLQLLEFPANGGGYGEVISLGDGSNAQNSLAMVPSELIVDRVYVHGDSAGQKRGIGLNSASTTVRDSYISNIWWVGQDSQAIAGWNGPGPYVIENNYLEAASENFLLGGSDPAIENLIPSDVTFTHNHVTKPLEWRSRSNVNVKNLFELKNAQRVTIKGNVFENNWLAAQAGYAIVLTGRSQDGRAPWSVVQDLEFSDNVVRNVSSAINVLGKDYYYPSGTSGRFVFRNNLFQISSASFGGSGRFLLINGGVDITVDHNTIIQDGYSVLYADTNPVQQFTMTNNIAPDNAWAIMGGGTSPGNGTIATYFPNGTFLRGVWAGSNPGTYPTGNYYPASLAAVGFVDAANGDYRLAPTSIYTGAALDGTSVGADIDAIAAAVQGVIK